MGELIQSASSFSSHSDHCALVMRMVYQGIGTMLMDIGGQLQGVYMRIYLECHCLTVMTGTPYNEVIQSIRSILEGKVIIGHSLWHDFKVSRFVVFIA